MIFIILIKVGITSIKLLTKFYNTKYDILVKKFFLFINAIKNHNKNLRDSSYIMVLDFRLSGRRYNYKLSY